MPWNYGPERAEAITVLREQIRRARIRLDAIGATADAPETSYDARDAGDIAYGELRDEIGVLEEALDRLVSDGDAANDVLIMEQALEILRRDIEQ